MASLRVLASPARTGVAPSTLISTSNVSHEAQRAIATSSRALRAPQPASQPGRIPKPQEKNEPGRFGLAPLSSPAPPHASKPYGRLTVSIVNGLAKLMGYNRLSSSAIRATSDMYDRCSEVSELQRDFWYRDAALPASYQTWFHITHLHVWILLVRFRALKDQHAAQSFAQELINHFFIDAESRMREKFGVQTLRLVKGYLKDMHQQQRGALIGLDQGLASTTDDVHLAQALWRNLWGGGGFEGDVAGVKRKIRGIDRTMKGEDPSEEGTPEMALDQSLLHSADGSAPSPATDPLAAQHPELAYPQQLARLTVYVRREVRRLAQISDQDIMAGRIAGPEAPTVFGDV